MCVLNLMWVSTRLATNSLLATALFVYELHQTVDQLLIPNWSDNPCCMITSGHHREVSNCGEDVNTWSPTGHEFHVEHVAACRSVHRAEESSPVPTVCWQNTWLDFRVVFIRLLLMESTLRTPVSDAWLPWKQWFWGIGYVSNEAKAEWWQVWLKLWCLP